jgi:hypothetical protein
MGRAPPRPFGWLLVMLWASACGPAWEPPSDPEGLFDAERVRSFELRVRSAAWLRLLVEPQEYVEAELSLDGTRYGPIGLRALGDPRAAQPAWRLRFDAFDPGLRLAGLKRVNLLPPRGDPSLVRQPLGLELVRQAGALAPRGALAEVRVNGTGPGAYALVEQVDRRFLADRLGDANRDGFLFQLERGGNLVFRGDEPGAYPDTVYELKSEDEPGARATALAPLVAFMRVLALTPDAELDLALAWLLEVDATLGLWAALAWLAHMDSYLGTGHNLYLYLDESGRLWPIAWDLNRAFGNYHGPSCPRSTDELLELDPLRPACGGARPLVERLLGHPRLGARYRAQLAELVDGPLRPDAVAAAAARWRARAAGLAVRDRLGAFTPEDFEAAFEADWPPNDNPARVPGLGPFALARDGRCRRALAGPEGAE